MSESQNIEWKQSRGISRPRNPLIADVCFKAGYIDSWGRGTIKIYEACENCLADSFLFTIFLIKNVFVNQDIFRNILY